MCLTVVPLPPGTNTFAVKIIIIIIIIIINCGTEVSRQQLSHRKMVDWHIMLSQLENLLATNSVDDRSDSDPIWCDLKI
jgi:hypothetical protein